MPEYSTDKTGHCRGCVFKGACKKCLKDDNRAWNQKNGYVISGVNDKDKAVIAVRMKES